MSKAKTMQELAKETVNEALDNATINNIPFREWIDNVKLYQNITGLCLDRIAGGTI